MKWLLTCLTIAVATCGLAYADSNPKFKDYPSKMYSGREAPLRLDTSDAKRYRTRLRDAITKPVNFGGRYVFTQWGAGTGCDTGALVNVATGEAYILPFAACNWSGFDRPFEFRNDSRLFVVAGQVGEDGPRGTHFFEFTGREFREVGSKAAEPVTANVPSSIAPSAGPVEQKGIIETNPQMRLLWSCFETGLKLNAQQIAEAVPDERRYISAVFGLGGFMTIGDKIRAACNSSIVGDVAIKSEAPQKVNDLFVATLFAMDTRLLEKCENQTDPAWNVTKQLCEANVLKYKNMLHLP